jgi:enoyl-CoA hydratase/carnithine racemase
MPEVSIGFFPDVGSAHFLQRLPPSLGLLLALTGMSLQGGEVYCCGLATHFVPAARLRGLRQALLGPRGAAVADFPGLNTLLHSFQVRDAPGSHHSGVVVVTAVISSAGQAWECSLSARGSVYQ